MLCDQLIMCNSKKLSLARHRGRGREGRAYSVAARVQTEEEPSPPQEGDRGRPAEDLPRSETGAQEAGQETEIGRGNVYTGSYFKSLIFLFPLSWGCRAFLLASVFFEQSSAINIFFSFFLCFIISLFFHTLTKGRSIGLCFPLFCMFPIQCILFISRSSTFISNSYKNHSFIL